jgi:ornithine cyclodeaminase
MIVTATTSPEPVLPDELPAETFVAAVGSFRPEMAELPPALVASATVVVDNLEGAREEAGDLIRASQSGAFGWKDAVTLGGAISGGRLPAARPVVFESVGHALWDLAAARLAYGKG